MLVHPAIAESCACAIDGVVSDPDVRGRLAAAAVEGPELLGRFAGISDGRGDQGRDHPVAAVLTLCAAAVLAGMRSFTAIAGWIADVPTELLALLYSTSPRTPARTPGGPSKTTLWRVLTGVDAAAVDAAIGSWLAEQARHATAAGTSPAGRASDAANRTDTEPVEQVNGPLLAVAVDGKTVRGAVAADGTQVHLLAAATHGDQLVLGQVEVGAKTNEVRREAPCRIPDSVRRNLEDSSWARWLTRSRKVMGTRACHEYRRSCPDARNDASGGPRDMAKAVLPEAQSPAMQVFIHRKWRLKPVPRSAPDYLVARRNLRSGGRCPVRTFKGMSGTPTSRCYVRQGRTRDRLRGASSMATVCS